MTRLVRFHLPGRRGRGWTLCGTYAPRRRLVEMEQYIHLAPELACGNCWRVMNRNGPCGIL